MSSSPRTSPLAWVAVTAALACGLLEWMALSRSRAADAWAAWQGRLSRR